MKKIDGFPLMKLSVSCGSIPVDLLCRSVTGVRHQELTSQYWELPTQKHVNSIISTGRPAVFAALLLYCVLTPRLHGQAQVDDHNPVGVTGIFEGAITTGCAYNLLSHSATRAINDIVVPG